MARHLQIYGDSKIIINWFNNITTCHAYTLKTILEDIIFLKTHLDHVACTHIYREHNEGVDKLSKEATHHPRGEWMIIGHSREWTYHFFHRPYMDQELQRADRP